LPAKAYHPASDSELQNVASGISIFTPRFRFFFRFSYTLMFFIGHLFASQWTSIFPPESQPPPQEKRAIVINFRSYTVVALANQPFYYNSRGHGNISLDGVSGPCDHIARELTAEISLSVFLYCFPPNTIFTHCAPHAKDVTWHDFSFLASICAAYCEA